MFRTADEFAGAAEVPLDGPHGGIERGIGGIRATEQGSGLRHDGELVRPRGLLDRAEEASEPIL